MLGTMTSIQKIKIKNKNKTPKPLNRCQLLLYGHNSEPSLELLPMSEARGMEVSSGLTTESSGAPGIQDRALSVHIHSFIHSFDSYLLSAYYVPGTGDSVWKKTQSLSS